MWKIVKQFPFANYGRDRMSLIRVSVVNSYIHTIRQVDSKNEIDWQQTDIRQVRKYSSKFYILLILAECWGWHFSASKYPHSETSTRRVIAWSTTLLLIQSLLSFVTFVLMLFLFFVIMVVVIPKLGSKQWKNIYTHTIENITRQHAYL